MMQDETLKFKIDKTLGYKYAYSPNHPLANASGKVYEHIYIMVNSIGRKLHEDEVVHHIDRNRANNEISNLALMTSAEHRLLHLTEDNHTKFIEISCKTCGEVFRSTEKRTKQFCSQLCSTESRRKVNITREELETMVWEYPSTTLAELLGVSDAAISKRCKSLGIGKPPRGYWSKIRSQDTSSGAKQ